MDSFEARVIETPCKYDIIFGRQELTKYAIDLSFSDLSIKFADVCRPMSSTTSLKMMTTLSRPTSSPMTITRFKSRK
jgi:hypothetical protein